MDILNKLAKEVEKADAELHEIVDNKVLKNKGNEAVDEAKEFFGSKRTEDIKSSTNEEAVVVEGNNSNSENIQFVAQQKCHKCGTDLENGTLYCSNCGTKQESLKVCRKCGAVLKNGNGFCTECGNKIDSNNNIFIDFIRNNKYKYITILAVITFVFIGVFGLINVDTRSSNIPVMTVKAEELINDYIRDPYTAERKYKGQRINISGQVIGKGQFKGADYYFIMIASKRSNGKTYEVLLEFKPDKVFVVNKFNFDDFIVASGTCGGIVPQEDPNMISIQIQYVDAK